MQRNKIGWKITRLDNQDNRKKHYCSYIVGQEGVTGAGKYLF